MFIGPTLLLAARNIHSPFCGELLIPFLSTQFATGRIKLRPQPPLSDSDHAQNAESPGKTAATPLGGRSKAHRS
ncbi:MAG: hypothetical protein NXH84_18260, partial [Rhodobacteraceae bacterium]|nr:hypothetical protein [Paracoccaceae bacterium]